MYMYKRSKCRCRLYFWTITPNSGVCLLFITDVWKILLWKASMDHRSLKLVFVFTSNGLEWCTWVKLCLCHNLTTDLENRKPFLKNLIFDFVIIVFKKFDKLIEKGIPTNYFGVLEVCKECIIFLDIHLFFSVIG